MKLSSLLLGDLADLFQDSKIDEAQKDARVASFAASNSLRNSRNLAEVVARRIQELEKENAVLGLLVLKILQTMADKDAEQVEKIVDEVRAQLQTPNAPQGIDFLRKALGFPELAKTPINDYAKPTTANKRPAGYYYPPPKSSKG